MELSGREYVDIYAQKAKNQPAKSPGDRSNRGTEPATPLAA